MFNFFPNDANLFLFELLDRETRAYARRDDPRLVIDVKEKKEEKSLVAESQVERSRLFALARNGEAHEYLDRSYWEAYVESLMDMVLDGSCLINCPCDRLAMGLSVSTTPPRSRRDAVKIL